ncbi:MAG: hypothetical protein KDD50_01835 [Bdellovibrionales bacterium]|nr:hypothetical protein [Bdellovibrionales bacterium]
MKKLSIVLFLLFGQFVNAEVLNLDLSDSSKWFCFAYDDVKQNKIKFSSKGLEIDVNASAGPCIYKLDRVSKIKNFKVHAKTDAQLIFPKDKVQGEKHFDDFSLRTGLVVVGGKRPGMIARWFIPKWVLNLYKLAPKDQGLKVIRLFTVAEDKDLLGSERLHWVSKRFSEKVSAISKNGEIVIDEPVEGLETIAIWVMADGDDLKSKFKTVVNKIEIERD